MSRQLNVAAHILGLIAFIERDQRRPVTSDELAESIGTNPVVVRRVLSQLKAAGLVDSRRGVGGGTVLARDPRQMTLRDAYEAVNEARGPLLERHNASPSDACRVAPVIAEYLDEIYGDAEEALLKRLSEVSVETMSRQIVDRLRRRSAVLAKDRR